VIPQLGLYDFSATESDWVVRLPLFYGLIENVVEWVGDGINNFFFRNK